MSHSAAARAPAALLHRPRLAQLFAAETPWCAGADRPSPSVGLPRLSPEDICWISRRDPNPACRVHGVDATVFGCHLRYLRLAVSASQMAGS